MRKDDDTTGLPELQEVLTRYVDSSQGYLQAAELMERPDFSAAFAEIAARRGEVALEIATLIHREGEAPQEEASTEGAVHRWWIRLRDSLSDEELEVVLGECIRGEKVLLAALGKALESPGIAAGNAAILRHARDEIKETITNFSIGLKK